MTILVVVDSKAGLNRNVQTRSHYVWWLRYIWDSIGWKIGGGLYHQLCVCLIYCYMTLFGLTIGGGSVGDGLLSYTTLGVIFHYRYK